MKKSILFSILAILITGLGFGKIANHVNAENNYSEEFYNAYNFAYKNGITTVNNINDAQMNGPLTRIAMAKMLSNYAINILNKKPNTSKIPNFSDVTKNLDSQYNNGVTLAYQLGIMGVGVQNFRPYDTVTRAEFCTALSRMLYGLEDGTDNYYSTHIKKLEQEGIISNNNPKLNEKRGYVMIMLMRSQNSQSDINKNSNTVPNNNTTQETENKTPKPQGEKTDTTSDFITHSTIDGITLLTICNPNDSTECLTMMDRNLGATTNNINNTGSYGYKYQWGNNYGFSRIEDLTIQESPVNAKGYGPYNYYNSNTFIASNIIPHDRSSTRNDNLWGGELDNFDDNYLGYPFHNPTDRKGPCPNGYHVPSMGERFKVMEWWAGNYSLEHINILEYDEYNKPYISSGEGELAFTSDFLIPHSSYFYINRPMYGGATTVTEDGAHTDMFSILRTSSPTPYTSGYGGDSGSSNIVEESRDSWALHFLSNHYIIGAAEPREIAAPVRCFKN